MRFSRATALLLHSFWLLLYGTSRMERHKEVTCHTQLKTVISIQILILRRIYDSYF